MEFWTGNQICIFTMFIDENKRSAPPQDICIRSPIFSWLVVFYVLSTARSFRDGTPHLLSLVEDVKLDFTQFPNEIVPRAVA